MKKHLHFRGSWAYRSLSCRSSGWKKCARGKTFPISYMALTTCSPFAARLTAASPQGGGEPAKGRQKRRPQRPACMNSFAACFCYGCGRPATLPRNPSSQPCGQRKTPPVSSAGFCVGLTAQVHSYADVCALKTSPSAASTVLPGFLSQAFVRLFRFCERYRHAHGFDRSTG